MEITQLPITCLTPKLAQEWEKLVSAIHVRIFWFFDFMTIYGQFEAKNWFLPKNWPKTQQTKNSSDGNLNSIFPSPELILGLMGDLKSSYFCLTDFPEIPFEILINYQRRPFSATIIIAVWAFSIV